MNTGRRAELAGNLDAVRGRIARACELVDRDPAGVQLLVVTKTFPASDVHLLADLGVQDVGENRDQEAKAKWAACAGLPLRWHLIGQLQRNKVNSVLAWADMVQTVDSRGLAEALDAAAGRVGRRLAVLVQVALDIPVQSERGGCAPTDLPALVKHLLTLDHLELQGVLGVAPYPGDPAPAFTRLAKLADQVRSLAPNANQISAGMSGDFEAAIVQGATQVRLGGAVLGNRPALP